jgi:threonine dehydrogenase-like Zn-dependent dehydrogenase
MVPCVSGIFQGITLFIWALGLIGNATWAVATLVGAARSFARGDRKRGREALAVGGFLTVMLAVSGLIFVFLFRRWVKT